MRALRVLRAVRPGRHAAAEGFAAEVGRELAGLRYLRPLEVVPLPGLQVLDRLLPCLQRLDLRPQVEKSLPPGVETVGEPAAQSRVIRPLKLRSISLFAE